MQEDIDLLTKQVAALSQECRELAEGLSTALGRLSLLEHIVAVGYFKHAPIGAERGTARRLINEGKRIRLVLRDEELHMEEQLP